MNIVTSSRRPTSTRWSKTDGAFGPRILRTSPSIWRARALGPALRRVSNLGRDSMLVSPCDEGGPPPIQPRPTGPHERANPHVAAPESAYATSPRSRETRAGAGRGLLGESGVDLLPLVAQKGDRPVCYTEAPACRAPRPHGRAAPYYHTAHRRGVGAHAFYLVRFAGGRAAAKLSALPGRRLRAASHGAVHEGGRRELAGRRLARPLLCGYFAEPAATRRRAERLLRPKTPPRLPAATASRRARVHRVVAVVPTFRAPGDVGLVRRQRRLREVVPPVHAQSRASDLDPGVDVRIKSLQCIRSHFGQDEAEVGDAPR